MSMEPAPPPQLLTSELKPAQSLRSSMVDNNMESPLPPDFSASELEPDESSNAAMVDSKMEPDMPPDVWMAAKLEQVQSTSSSMENSDMEPAQSVHFSVADIASVSKSPWRMEWFMALHEEDCLKIRKLLHKDPRLVIVHPDEAERQTLDRMRFGWRGCTALHVAVKKGWSLLVEEILDKFEYRNAGIGSVITDETSKGSWDPSIELKNLLLVFDGDCQIDALGIAIASFNMKIVSLLTDAFRKCKYDDPYRLKHRTYNVSSVGIWTRRGNEMVIDTDALRKMTKRVVGDLPYHEKYPNEEQRKEIAKQFIDSLIHDEEEEPKREKLREISREFIDGFVVDAAEELQNRTLLLEITRDFREHRTSDLTEFFYAQTDFNFLPIEIYLFHALCASEEFRWYLSLLAKSILEKGESLFVYVFELRDAQGRTPLHVAMDYDNLASVLQCIPEPQGKSETGRETSVHKPRCFRGAREASKITHDGYQRCRNARDSVGRTALHRAAMLESPVYISKGVLDIGYWRPPSDRGFFHHYEKVLLRNGYFTRFGIDELAEWILDQQISPVDLASLSVNVSILLHQKSEDISGRLRVMLEIAAASGDAVQVVALRDMGKLDARMEDRHGNNLLHLALRPRSDGSVERMIESVNGGKARFNGIRSCVEVFNIRVSDRNRIRGLRVSPPPTSSVQSDKGRQACINLLLEAGVDAFHRNHRGLLPNVGPEASPEMRLWWSERVAKVTQEMNSSLALAANAISVTAALVATASFIGPLQPPLGYGTSSDGLSEHMQLGILTVRVFFLSNTLAFYLALSAIMLSLIPALPFPNESMEAERKRSRLTVVLATSLLMASMVLILVAFTTASIAVSSNEGSLNSGGSMVRPFFIGGGVISLLITWWCCGRIFRLISLIYKSSVIQFYMEFLLDILDGLAVYGGFNRHGVVKFSFGILTWIAFLALLLIYGVLLLLWLLIMVGFNLINYREIFKNPTLDTKDTILWNINEVYETLRLFYW